MVTIEDPSQTTTKIPANTKAVCPFLAEIANVIANDKQKNNGPHKSPFLSKI